MSTKTVKPFGFKDKFGYMLGDVGNDFSFILSSSFMLKFYTDVMGIDAGVVGLVMMASRFVDAVTDVSMGQIVDRSKPTKNGKFRPWIARMCGPVAIASFLIYQSGFADMSYTFKVIWMAVTYLLWGSFFYTAVNIPYGSMASAISSDAKDRAQLSTWRTAGGTFAGLLIGMLTPMFAYVTVNGQTVLSGPRMTIIAGIFSVLSIICYILCFYMTTERIEVPANNQKLDVPKMLKNLVTNKALLGIIIAAILLLLSQLGMQGMAGYVFPNFYGSALAQSLSSLIGTGLILVVCAPTAVKLSTKYGKKELSFAACVLAGVSFLVCLVLQPENVWVYVAFFAIGNIGVGYFNVVIWAMITDVIDDAEIKNGIREDGTIYSVYSFARKMGQALSSGLTGGLLTLIGYTEATAFDPDVTLSIFRMSCIIPAAGFILVAVVLVAFYPLSKKKVEENIMELKKRRGAM